MKSPITYMNRRHLSIQIDLWPHSELKTTDGLHHQVSIHNWRTEVKDDNGSRTRVPHSNEETKIHTSLSRNKKHYKKFEQKDSNYIQQVEARDSSVENIQFTDDEKPESVRKHLDFRQNTDLNREDSDENCHPNMNPLKTDRTVQEGEKLHQYNKIPLGSVRREKVQKSAPRKSKWDDEFMNAIFSNSSKRRDQEENNSRSISNDKNSSKAGSTHSNGSKFVVQKINESARGSLQSSIHLSSHMSYNLSASDSAGAMDSSWIDDKRKLKNSNIGDIKVAAFNMDDELLKSGCTLELSEDDEDDYDFNLKSNIGDEMMNKKFTYQNALKELHETQFPKDKIYVQQNYTDEVNSADFQKVNIKVDHDSLVSLSNEETMRVQYANHRWTTEEDKLCEYDSLDEEPILKYNQTSPDVNLRINIPTESNEEENQKSLFDNGSKLSIQNLVPRLMSKYSFCDTNSH